MDSVLLTINDEIESNGPPMDLKLLQTKDLYEVNLRNSIGAN